MLSIIKINSNLLVIRHIIVISIHLFAEGIIAQNLTNDSTFFKGVCDLNVVSSDYNILYSNVKNVLIIRLPNTNPGKIFLKPLIDTSKVELKTTFLVNDDDWNFELVEEARKEIPDNGVIKFEIVPRMVGNILFDLFVIDSISTVHYARFSLDVEKLPEPELTIAKLDKSELKIDSILHELKDVKVVNLSMYKNAKNIYGVTHMRITITSKKGERKFRGNTYANYITSNIEKAIANCKKGDIIKVEIASKILLYNPVTIIVNK